MVCLVAVFLGLRRKPESDDGRLWQQHRSCWHSCWWCTCCQLAPLNVSASPQTDLVLEVETDPIPNDAIRVCNDCDQNDLQAVIDAAPDGSVIVVEGGQWPPLTINSPIRLVGLNWPLIDANSEGSGIVIDSDDVTVEGFDIRNTGRSFDKEDSGIYFEGQRTRILNNRLTEVLRINGAADDSVCRQLCSRS